MPHYKNGKLAKVGDFVTWATNGYTKALGFVTAINPGAKTCDAYVAPLATVTESDGLRVILRAEVTAPHLLTLGECLPLVEEFIATEVMGNVKAKTEAIAGSNPH